MMISTRGRYALRVMLDLAQNGKDGFISLKSVAERQEISMKYMEMIVAALNKAGFLQSQRGKDGGYKLTREPKDYRLGEILRVAEGGLEAVTCSECGEEKGCVRSDTCMTLPVWQNLDSVINGYLDSVSLEDVMERKVSDVLG